MFYSHCAGGLWAEGAEHLFKLHQESGTMLCQTQLLFIFTMKNIHLDYYNKQINMGK